MIDRRRFLSGVSLPVLLVVVFLLAGTPPVHAAGGPGQGCTDCHKAGRRSPGAVSGKSEMVHIGGVSPHKAAVPAGPSPGGQGASPVQAPGPANPSTGTTPAK